MMKASLKEWHQQHSQNMEGKILEVKNIISCFDSKGEVSTLLDDEVQELHDLSVNFHSLARAQNSINWQKARLNWLQEGDANSKNFHGFASQRRRGNSIHMVNVNGVNVEGVHNIRTAVFSHFFNQFKTHGVVQPCMEGLTFCKLS